MFKFATPIFLILLSGALAYFFIDPNYQEIKKLKIEKIQYDEALDKSKELRGVRDALLSKYNTFNPEDIDRLEKIVPNNVDNVKLIMEIDSMASKYGATIRKVDVGISADETDSLGPNTKGYNTINLNLKIEASYKDFIKFLDDLSSSLRIMDINELSFESSKLSLYQFKLNFKTYWLEE